MSKTRKQQKAVSRKLARRKARPGRGLFATPPKQPSVERAKEWPVLECLIAAEWQRPAALSQIVVARRSPLGEVAMASFLVDLGCLGVKDAMTRYFPSEAAYRQTFLTKLKSVQKMQKCSLDLAAKVIGEAIQYARDLGFEPHPDSQVALPILEGTHPEDCPDRVPLGGENGKPLFFAGPYDDPQRIIRTLERTVGPGNFDYMVAIGGPDDFFDEVP
ncbi:MAG: hypothetical protein AB1791_22445 [Chloroflexota bacterium]